LSVSGGPEKAGNDAGNVRSLGPGISRTAGGRGRISVKLLLDTPALIWFLRDDPELSPLAARAVEDSRHQVWVSAAALWEISVKASAGTMPAPKNFGEGLHRKLEEAGFHLLPVEPRHAEEVFQLPRVHPDGFDRLMIAQCRLEKLTAVTPNPEWADRRYEISTIWK